MGKVNGDSFENGAFNGIQRQVNIEFRETIQFIPESSFKSILDENQQNYIEMFNERLIQAYIDCEQCKNHWLIRDNKTDQIKNAFCIHNHKKTLFNDDVKSKLKTKCH